MPQPQTSESLLSQRIGQKIFLWLCVFIPLVMHTGIYNFALLPKRLVLQIALAILAILWVRDIRLKRTTIYSSPFDLPLLG